MSDLISKIYDEREFFLIAGPCVIENAEHTYRVAKMLKELCEADKLTSLSQRGKQEER